MPQLHAVEGPVIMLANLLGPFSNPEYAHVVLNGFVTHGTTIGIVILAAGLVFRRRPVQVTGLVVIGLCCLMAWPVEEQGEKAFDLVTASAALDARAWLHEHAARVDRFVWVIFVTGIVALVAAVLPARFPKLALPLALVVLALALAAQAVGIHIAEAGGRIRHAELRFSELPAHLQQGADDDSERGGHGDHDHGD